MFQISTCLKKLLHVLSQEASVTVLGPTTHTRDQNRAPGSWLQPSLLQPAEEWTRQRKLALSLPITHTQFFIKMV